MSILEARLSSALYPYVGSRPIAAVTAQELLAVLRRIEARGRHETAHRVRALAGRVLRYAVARGRAQHDVAADLKDALAPVKSRNFASVKGEPHIVPIARQALAIVRELEPFARGGRYLFPSLRTRERPMSENTINAALRRLGYTTEEQTGHGFRSMASTLLNEQGLPPDVIELQLAHTERNKVRAAYNKAQRLTERRKMMQAWADCLDMLRVGADVVPIKRVVSAA